MPNYESPAIVCTYRYTAHRFHGRCERYGVEVGPFLSRDQCEAAVLAEIRKQIHVHDETCFRHEATEVGEVGTAADIEEREEEIRKMGEP